MAKYHFRAANCGSYHNQPKPKLYRLFLTVLLSILVFNDIENTENSHFSGPGFITTVKAQPSTSKSWNAEHRFVEGDAYLEIDKSYLGGNSTTYEFKVAPLSDQGNRLRVAI